MKGYASAINLGRIAMTKTLAIEELQKKALDFVQKREWEQYQTARDICMALSIEASELLENFLWLKDDEVMCINKDLKKMSSIKEEVADVFYWLIRLSDILKIDLENAFVEKMKKNILKYPIDLSKGNRSKYTELSKNLESTKIDKQYR